MIISKKAMSGDFSPKKITDQEIFSPSCRPKTAIAFSSFQEPTHNLFEIGFQYSLLESFKETLICQFFSQTKYRDIPINRKRIVQTGAKTQSGGANPGLERPLYHEATAGAVKIDPTKPAPSQIKMLVISFIAFPIIFLFFTDVFQQ